MGRHEPDLVEQTIAAVSRLRGEESGGEGAEGVRDHSSDMTSGDINAAVETLVRAGIPPMTRMALDTWNLARIRRWAPERPTPDDVRTLMAGLNRRRLSAEGFL